MKEADDTQDNRGDACPGLMSHECVAKKYAAEADKKEDRADQEKNKGPKTARELFSAGDREMHDGAEDHHDDGWKKKEATGDDPEDAKRAEMAFEARRHGSECGRGDDGASAGWADGGSRGERASAMVAEHSEHL